MNGSNIRIGAETRQPKYGFLKICEVLNSQTRKKRAFTFQVRSKPSL